MPRVLFTGDFDFKPKPSVTQTFRAGDEKMVTSACADAAVAAGKGTIVKKPKAEDA